MNTTPTPKSKIVEIIGPPGVGKSTIYESLCKEWQPNYTWIFQEALFAPAFIPLFSFSNWIKHYIVIKLGKRRIRKLPIELGLRFANKHIELANFYWEHISNHNVFDYKEIARKLRAAYFLYTDFCKYQSIYERSQDKICLVNEGLFQKSFLIHHDRSYTRDILCKYLTLVPVPHAIITINVNDRDIIKNRLRLRSKVIASHLGKDDNDIIKDIEDWQYALSVIIEEAQKQNIVVLKVDATKPVKENVHHLKELLQKI